MLGIDSGSVSVVVRFYGLAENTFVCSIRQAHRVYGLLCSARDIKRMALDRSIFIFHFIQPVSSVPFAFLYPFPVTRCQELIKIERFHVVIGLPFLSDHCIIRSVQQVEFLVYVLYAIVSVILDGSFSFTALFGGYQDNTVGGACSVDGCRCGIFKYIQ